MSVTYRNAGLHLCLIEPDPANQRHAQVLAEELGISMTVAGDSASGLTLIQQLLPDGVICALDLPNDYGYDVLARLNQNWRTKDIPFFLSHREWIIGENWSLPIAGTAPTAHLGRPLTSDDLRGAASMVDRAYKNLYWVEQIASSGTGYGVTAYSTFDCVALLERYVGCELQPITDKVLLLQSTMGLAFEDAVRQFGSFRHRGIWFPTSTPLE